MATDPQRPVWSPLSQPLFRALWLASFVSSVGTWMQDVGATWLMTTLTVSPVMVALLATAASLPFFLLAPLAGALADIVDRRTLLLVTQGWMLVSAAVLGGITLAGRSTPGVLLLLTFILGIGNALNGPAWLAIVPELVDRPTLPAAITLNGLGVNLSRAIGPALGGLILAIAGSGPLFLLNALSYLAVMLVLARWKRGSGESAMPAERVVSAVIAGMRYVRHAQPLQVVLVRTAAFIFFGSVVWALMPVLARHELGLGPMAYGMLWGSLGLGAVAGAVGQPRLRHHLSSDRLVAGSTVVFGLAVIGMALRPPYGALCLAMFVAGVAWILILSVLNTGAQQAVPDWVRGRALAVFMLALQGSLALGAALWGLIASRFGTPGTFVIAVLGLVAALALGWRFRLATAEGLDLAPAVLWPLPVVAREPRPEHGPVLVTTVFHVDTRQVRAFVGAMQRLGRNRRRDGAMRWGLFADPAVPGRFVETFVVESWGEHLRQHARHTEADRQDEERVLAFHVGPGPPLVTHLIAASAYNPLPEAG